MSLDYMKDSFVADFENKVLLNLRHSNIKIEENSGLKIGIAVSGGADSLSLLFSFAELSKKFGFFIYVVTVNHNIRASEETAGDADYVIELCKKLKASNTKIFYECFEIERGKIQAAAIDRGCGIEEAARFFRYKIFEEFIDKYELDYLALAHNKNDQFETLLMRFLQGSFIESSSGISAVREKYIRPLLDVERNDIEKYLENKGIVWKTDSTNLDENYLRNKIRLKLVPFLNAEFNGWQTGVASGLEKSILDKEIIEEKLNDIHIFPIENGCYVLAEDFFNCLDGIKLRVLLKMFNISGGKKRIPFVFLKDVIKTYVSKKDIFQSGSVKKYFNDFCFCYEKNKIFVKKNVKLQTDLIFSDIIEESGCYFFPFGNLSVDRTVSGFYNIVYNEEVVLKRVKLPLCIRNFRIDDEIKTKDGTFKKIADIFTDWHVDVKNRSMIPLVQNLMSEKQEIICILGCVCGFNNWIVN